MKYIILLNILFCFSLNSSAQEKVADENPFETEMIFTSKDKDFLQLWHYEQVLQMKLDQEGRDNYLALLNYYTYKMSRLGLKKYGYTDAERKVKFDALVEHLNSDMKDLLNSSDYEVHKESFKKIEKLVYDKRNWDN